MSKIDWDWTLGILIQIVIFYLWVENVYYGFTTLQPIFAIWAGMYCFWFIFFPWCISGYLKFIWGVPLRNLPTIYGRVCFDHLVKKYGWKVEDDDL